MKELKFRAWDKEIKKMLFFDGIFNRKPYTEKSSFPQYESFPSYHELELIQYTGLKDRNGKEIYEGDVVKIVKDDNKRFANEPELGFEYDSIAKVGWDSVNATFYLFNLSDTDSTSIGYYCGWTGWNWLEVIGNIYENPELLIKQTY